MAGRHTPDPDWYAVLEVPPGADETAIRAAHRRRARDLHPDVNPAPDATARMAELNRARDILLDPAQRAAFDRDRQPTGEPGTTGLAAARSRARRSNPAEAGEPMRFTFGRQRPPGQNAEPKGPVYPGAEARVREAARWRFDPAAGPKQENWYAFLGVHPWSTGEDVRRACERLAKEATGLHLGADERARRAAKLRAAAETLGNAERKQAYDDDRQPWRPALGRLRDYYGQLGIRSRATPEEVAEAVTDAHLALGKIRSPEARAQDAAIREAHWVLRDPARRAAYDEARTTRG